MGASRVVFNRVNIPFINRKDGDQDFYVSATGPFQAHVVRSYHCGDDSLGLRSNTPTAETSDARYDKIISISFLIKRFTGKYRITAILVHPGSSAS